MGTPRHNPIHDDMLLEVFKHLDAFSLARVSCVSKQWSGVARHEKLWESLCILHWPAAAAKRSRRSSGHKNPLGSGPVPACSSAQQIRAVVESLGGFRRFFFLHLGPMLKRNCCQSQPRSTWGRDEVNLSLSLYSIDCFLRGSSSNPGPLLKRKLSSLE
ncbi:F-box protein GID2-like [Selaginella moellendorffii]|uniref:Putative F-box GID2 protein n=1 Tax=Selaginella moellendorffii TaxID=88036 RepID=A9LY11_SELML|nr:F-box protein GID2-like [Selaginella moellendorffii]ABX10760.1 putative F-box GID2 protein [Selaginella moellendorffii]|eukprot:XP_024540088.1 F-box protein GID2-like [Selaginella moellendorffii]